MNAIRRFVRHVSSRLHRLRREVRWLLVVSLGLVASAIVIPPAASAVGATPDPVASLSALGNCATDAVLVQGDTGEWITIDLYTGDYYVGDDQQPDAINGIGYNVKDDRVWGFTRHTDASNGRYLAVTGLDSNGARGTEYVGPFPGLSETGWYYVGDIDATGTLYLSSPGDESLVAIALDPSQPNYQQIVMSTTYSPPTGAADWAFSPIDGQLYTLARGNLWRIDPVTFTNTDLGPANVPNGPFGAVYMDEVGALYGSLNTDGQIFRIPTAGLASATDYDETQTTLFSTATASNGNDGARCMFAPLPFDHGDAPDTYGTMLANSGAEHAVSRYNTLNFSSLVSLGSVVDIEGDGQPSPLADFDNLTTVNDEDGVVLPMLTDQLTSYSATATVTNASVNDVVVAGWIDFNSNGTFDTSELVTDVVAPSATPTAVTLTWPVPADVSAGDTYARFRVSSALPVDASGNPSPTGTAPNGEVEDYALTILSPGLTLDKTASPTTFSNAGDVITYSFKVQNTGTATLTDVAVSDPLAGLSALDCGPVAPATLAPDESMTCTATYAVTQADVDAGGVPNTAAATGIPPVGPAVTDKDSTSVTSTSTPSLAVTKTATPDVVSAVGDVVTYTIVATNTGNVTLSDVSVTDTLPGLSPLSCTPAAPATLAPEAEIVCTATYLTTQLDLDKGRIDNTATATGTTPNGKETTGTGSTSVTSDQMPKLDLTKTASPTEFEAAGEVVNYTLVATNTGNVTLSNVSISDPLPGLSTLTCSSKMPTTLAPTEVLTCTASYTVTQADVDAGQVVNTAAVTGTPPAGGSVSTSAKTTVTGSSKPAISLVKSVLPESYSRVGTELVYTLVATNTGNVTLSDVTVADALDGLSDLTCSVAMPAVLEPGASLTCTATYTVTQADLDAAKVDNAAAVTGEPPTGETVTSTDSVSVTAGRTPLVELTKTADTNLVTRLGQVVTYTLVAVNTGNVTIHNVVIDDPRPGVTPLQCSTPMPTTLAPGETLTCTTTFTVTELPRGGHVDNTANVTGDDGNDQSVGDNASVSVPIGLIPVSGGGLGLAWLGLLVAGAGTTLVLLSRSRRRRTVESA